jgi:Mrp family chromosome partitioning ATPase
MVVSRQRTEASALRLLEELPGIADVVWATVTRLASLGAESRGQGHESAQSSSSGPTCVLFTAPEARAGTSLLAAATAIGLAQHQRVPVCLLETNVRRPALAAWLGLAPAGLSDVLDGRAELEECLQEPRGCPGVLVLPAGTARDAAPGEFATGTMDALLAALARRCRYLVLDAAPVLEHVETRRLLQYADAALLVLRARVTRRDDAERAHELLLESGTPVLGTIFNAYRPEGFSGATGRANRALARAMRGERVRSGLRWQAAAPANGAHSAAGTDEHAELTPARLDLDGSGHGNGAENGAGNAAGNGHGEDHGRAPELPDAHYDLPTPEPGTEAAYRRHIDVLERRVAKLTQLLGQTEADLRRLAAMKDVDLGVASIYRSVQGLSSEEGAQAFKRSLMREIFQANLELKTAMARRS